MNGHDAPVGGALARAAAAAAAVWRWMHRTFSDLRRGIEDAFDLMCDHPGATYLVFLAIVLAVTTR